MRQTILFIVVLFWNPTLSSQEWAPEGAIWYYSLKADMATGYVKITVIGDTIIQDKSCRILQQMSYAWAYPGQYDTLDQGSVITYESEDIVYYWIDNKFYILYDFTAEKGDTWEVKIPGDSDTSGIVMVDSVNYETINDQLLKCLFISDLEGCVGFYNTKVIERIGATKSYMFPYYVDCIAHGLYGRPLRCYYENSNLFYKTDIASSCDYIVSNPELKTANQIAIFPNPFIERIFLENNSDSELNVSVYCVTGSMITNRIVHRNNSIIIDMKVYSGNLFLVKMDTDTQTITRLIVRE